MAKKPKESPYTDDDERALAQFCADCWDDPYKFVIGMFPWDTAELPYEAPDKWQEEVLKEIGAQLKSGGRNYAPIQIAVVSGHGVGKSALNAFLGNWFISTRPNDSKGLITANTMAQAKTKTWAEFQKWHNLALNKHWFTVTGTQAYNAYNKANWNISVTPWSKNNTEAFQGLHAGEVYIAMDEASAIPDIVWEVAEQAASTRLIWLVMGNPTKNNGRFYECWGKFAHRWTAFKVDSRTARMADKSFIQRAIADHGEDSDYVKMRIKGEFPSSATDQLIGSDLVEEAMARNIEYRDVMEQPIVFGYDQARDGIDMDVIVVRQGFKVIKIIKFNTDKYEKKYEILSNAVNSYNPALVNVDVTGQGAQVVEQLTNAGRSNVFGVKFNESATHDGYFNMRVQMWAQLRQWLRYGDIPNDSDLKRDLCAPSYFYQQDSEKMRLESKADMKSRGLPSPDIGDALALTFANLGSAVNPKTKIQTKIDNNIKKHLYSRGELNGINRHRVYR